MTAVTLVDTRADTPVDTKIDTGADTPVDTKIDAGVDTYKDIRIKTKKKILIKRAIKFIQFLVKMISRYGRMPYAALLRTPFP